MKTLTDKQFNECDNIAVTHGFRVAFQCAMEFLKEEPAPPAKKPWPISSVHVTAFSARWHIYDDAESLIAVVYSADQAHAIAHALNMHWRLVAWMCEDVEITPARTYTTPQSHIGRRTALLVECRAGGFEMPEVPHD